MTDGGRKPFVAAVSEKPEVLILAVFLIAGLALLVPAVRGASGVKRSGRSVFEMATVPGVIGGTLEGVIVTEGRLRLREDQGIRLHLKCVVITTKKIEEFQDGGWTTMSRTGSSLAWENDRVVNPAEVTRSGLETSIPVRMRIPASCRETAKSAVRRVVARGAGGARPLLASRVRGSGLPHRGQPTAAGVLRTLVRCLRRSWPEWERTSSGSAWPRSRSPHPAPPRPASSSIRGRPRECGSTTR